MTTAINYDRNLHLDLMLNYATLRAVLDGVRVDCVAAGLSNVEGHGMCVGVVNNNIIPGVINAGAAIVDDEGSQKYPASLYMFRCVKYAIDLVQVL